MKRLSIQLLAGAAFMTAAGITAFGSSHREAPGITGRPKLDGTDFYAFRSYEPGREGYVTLIANYIPLQDAYGGPNFFAMDPKAVYEIHVDNNGDAREDLTFQFRFTTKYRNLAVPAGAAKDVAIPLINIGPIGPDPGDIANLNTLETYSVSIIRGDRRGGPRASLRNAATNSSTFMKPADRIGDKSIPNYAQYADRHIYDVRIPGCSNGRLFVGQRREGFVVNLAEAFDLINLNPLGPVDGTENVLADKNITSLALEVPIACLTSGKDSVIGAWTTASEQISNGNGLEELRQMSRLGQPLVNELVIGLKDKDKFNASEPKHDGQFATYVTNPTLPVLINALFGVPAPATPRNDLVAVFLTGVPGLNKPASVTASEMLRLNTSIMPKAAAAQSPVGVLGGDTAGFPNGRRPGDDVVDIALRAVEGVLLPGHPAAVEQLTDGALSTATVNYTPDGDVTGDATFSLFRSAFPYLQTPLSGSPGPIHP
jgi:hypothetical protein